MVNRPIGNNAVGLRHHDSFGATQPAANDACREPRRSAYDFESGYDVLLCCSVNERKWGHRVFDSLYLYDHRHGHIARASNLRRDSNEYHVYFGDNYLDDGPGEFLAGELRNYDIVRLVFDAEQQPCDEPLRYVNGSDAGHHL